jgi:hypothetical protein
VTASARAGMNRLEITVVNLWPNLIIGDENLADDCEWNLPARRAGGSPRQTLKAFPQWLLDGKPSPAGRYTFSSWKLWKKGDPLQESGLLGPVTLCQARRIEL